MIPITQTKVVVRNSNDELIIHGNCFAAVVASILELPIEQVPNVETLFFLDGNDRHFWSTVMDKFLEGKGWVLDNDYRFAVYHDDQFEIDNLPAMVNAAHWYCQDKLYLVSGKSVRGVSHICIYKNGELIHDPHPTKEGIVTFDIFQTLEKSANV